MSNRLKLTKAMLLSCSALIPVLMAAEAHAQAVNLGGAGNLLIPDGRTQTQVTNNGNVTDIHTNTVSGNVGFNSFSQFQVGGGNNVNLHLPNNTETLVNIVRDGPAVVEGTVNALKNGTIGGNVVFSDPYGFVLGSQGVINTGSLTVNTPTREFLDGAINGNGEIDIGRANQLISGNVPLSPDGAVILNGVVNAANGISVRANTIDVGDESALERHQDLFQATVNTQGAPVIGAALVVKDGRISLVSAAGMSIGSKAQISARADASPGVPTVSLDAGGDLTIAQGARIEASTATGAALVRLDSKGNLVVAGDVLALGGTAAGSVVHVSGGSVAVAASGSLRVDGSLADAGSSITIASASDLVLDGRITALGAGFITQNGTAVPAADAGVALGDGGKVIVLAAGDVRFGSAGVIDASGASGGDIYLVAQRDLSMADGASVFSRGTTGPGGFLELSGHRTVDFGLIKLDLSSTGGEAGTLFIDPEDLVISNAATYVRGAAGSIIDNVGSVLITASNSITVAGGGQINTYKAGANALSVTLAAKAIRVESGGLISADADAGFARGDISLQATAEDIRSQMKSTAAASVYVGGHLIGRNVTLSAKAKADTHAITDLQDLAEVGLGALSPVYLSGLLFGVQGTYSAADASASVLVGQHAVIDSTGNVSLHADGFQEASNLGFNSGNGKLRATIALNMIDGETHAEIMSGAQIRAGGNLSVLATNSLRLGASATSLSSEDTPMSGALVVGIANLDTKAVINSGVTLNVGGDLTISAENTNSLRVSATSTSLGNGKVGVALGVHVSNLKADARLGSSVGSLGNEVGNVRVNATSNTLENSNGASTTVGTSAAIQGGVKLVKSVLPIEWFYDLLDKKMPVPVAGESIKAGLSVMYSEVTQSATASIAGDTRPDDIATPGPEVISSGNVSVISTLTDAQMRNSANTVIESGNTSVHPTATDAGAISVAIGQFEHVSHATIGNNTSITAQNLGVSASSDAPLVLAYDNANTPSEILKVIMRSLNGNGGIVNNILSSYAGSTVAARDVGIAGSVNYFGVSHDTLAWIGSGAKITTRSAGEAYALLDSNGQPVVENGQTVYKWGWKAPTAVSVAGEPVSSTVFQAGVDVKAYSHTDTINMAGSPAWMVLAGGNANPGGEGKSVGGSININLFNSQTNAGIGAGAEITSAAAIAVDARTLDTVVAITPSSGKGAAFGFNGLVSFLGLTNQTTASVSNTAKLSAAKTSVSAKQDLLVVAASGALSSGTGSNVGLSVVWSNLETNTQGFIGNNDALVAGTGLANYAGLATGTVTTDELAVTSNTAGANYIMSVAAAISSPNTGESSLGDSLAGGVSNGAGNLGAKLGLSMTKSSSSLGKLKNFFGNGMVSALGKVSSSLEPKSPPPGQTRKFAIAGAGSISGDTTDLDTQAFIDGATIDRYSALKQAAITVKATNDLLISTTSGAASIALAGASSAQSSAAIGAAFAIAYTDNQTRAAIRNSTISNAGSVRVASIASGQQVVLGLGVAANANANKSTAIAGSLSFGGSTDSVNSSIENSSVTATGAGKDVDVVAYQNTDIGIGGLAVAVATQGSGFGLAITVTVLTNPSDGAAVSARVHNSSLRSFRDISVEALTVSRVMSGAGSVAVAPNNMALNGSIVVNDISTDTLAEIKGDGSQRIETSRNVAVNTGSERRADIEAELAAVIKNKTIDAGFDFSDQVLGTGTTGGVIFGVSGTVGFGKKSAGAAIQYGSIRHDHGSYLSGVTVEALGDVAVSARDESKIFGTAAGIAVGTSGNFAGAGSLSINVIKNETTARISGTNTSVSARNVAVGAYNSSYTGGGAGALGISASGAGVGLSLVNNTIDNSTAALIEGVSVTANGIGGATGNIVVGAQSIGTMNTYAISVGAGEYVGIGGSVATSVALNDAQALVRGATLSADNNVLVQASNNDQINSVAGGVGIGLKAAGVGLSTATNIVRGQTVAAVEDLDTRQSQIRVGANGSSLSVDSGLVTTAFNYSAHDFANAMSNILPDMSFTSVPLRGLGVVATSRQAVGTFALAVSAAANPTAGMAASVSPVINVLGGDTIARVVNARINEGSDSANAGAEVKVIAASNTFAQNVVIGAAGSTGAAVASGFISNVMERNTRASVSGSTIGAAGGNVGAVLVRASGTMDSFNTVAGMALGAVGAAGSLAVNVFDATTTAQLSGGTVTARSAAIDARSTASFLGVTGAGAGGSNAIAGATSISVNLGSTRALVGDDQQDTRLVLLDDLDVTATSSDKQAAYAVGAAIAGGFVGGAAMLNFSVVMSDTIASVNRVTNSSMRDVSVVADNTTKLTPVTGGLGFAASGAGIGAGANVMLTKGTVSAEVINSAFTARGTLDVSAIGRRDINMITFTAGAGSSVGIGAALGILVVGIDMGEDAEKELGTTLQSANAQANQSANSQFVEAGTPGMRNTDGDTRDNLLTSAVGSAKRDSVKARIGNSTLTAGATTVLADSRISTINQAYGLGVGGVGAGAALAFSIVNQDVSAAVTSSTLTATSLAVKALYNPLGADEAVLVRAYAGAGALAGAMGAAVAVGHVESDVVATLSGTVNNASNGVSVLAEDRLTVKTDAIGAAVGGGVAVGVSLALSIRDADVQAHIAANSRIASAGGVSVNASSFGFARAYSKAGAGGLLAAGAGSSATALDGTFVLARLGDGAQLTDVGAGGVNISAQATPELKASSIGVAVSGINAVGASLGIAKATQTVRAQMGNAVTIGSTGKVSVLADLRSGSNPTVDSLAIAGAGSLFNAINATLSQSILAGETTASVGNMLHLTALGADLDVKATSRTRQRTDNTGVSLSFQLALGANVAGVKSDTLTQASIGNDALIAARHVTVSASGRDDNHASGMAGAGGAIAGSAAVVTNTALSRTLASIGGNISGRGLFLSGKLSLAAQHENVLGGTVDSVNAGIVGASGAMILTDVDAIVEASLADTAKVNASDFGLLADNVTRKPWEGGATNGDQAGWNLNSGSGGVVNLPAGSSRSTISHATRAMLGKNATVTLVAGNADISAHNRIDFFDKVKLDSGGAIALADTRTALNVTKNEATVSLDEGAVVSTTGGNIRLAAWDDATLDLRALATTYGIAGAPSGAAQIDYRRANLVTLARNVGLIAHAGNASGGGISAMAGAGLDGTLSRITAATVLDLFNNAAIPIPGIPDPVTNVSGDSVVRIAGGSTTINSGLRAASDIRITASRGTISAQALGTGKDVYREALAAIASGVSELFGGDKVTFDYKGGTTTVSGSGSAQLDGVVMTGIDRQKSITFTYATENTPNCNVATEACLLVERNGDIGYTVTAGVTVATTITDRLAKLRQLLSDYGSDPVAAGAYRSEIAFLEAKLIALGLSKNGATGAFSAPTEFEQAQQSLTLNKLELNGLGARFDTNTGSVVTAAGSSSTSAASIVSGASSAEAAASAGATAVTAIVTAAKAQPGYNAAANKAAEDNITALKASNVTLAGEIATLRGEVSTANTAVTTARSTIATAQATITSKQQAILNTPFGTPDADIAALQADIETARATIAEQSAIIKTSLDTIAAKGEAISTKTASISANLASMQTQQATLVGSNPPNSITTQQANLASAISSAGTASTSVSTAKGQVSGQLTTASSALTSIASYGVDNTLIADRISTIETNIRNNVYSKTNSALPSTNALTVEDVTARLGDIIIEADSLTGTGQLSAPGDAKISVVNNTANVLRVQNIAIDSESGGRIRFNGALVNSLSELNALNRPGSTAQFTSVLTSASQGNVLPQIAITSNYTADSAAFFDPRFDPTSSSYDASATSPYFYLRTPKPAPDILLLANKTLSNPRGSVSIVSEAGNVYMHGNTAAGSVGIVAKKGDYVQGFTYGIEHAGGDPAGRVATGPGILANGAVNISARYLNINSTIQSGIANLKLTIDSNPWLVGTAGEVGLSSTLLGQINAHRVAYAANPGTVSSVLTLAAGKLRYDAAAEKGAGQLQFTTAYLAEAGITSGAFRLLAGSGTNIGASYDASADNFVVDASNVRGGSIQIYGQIFNTSSSSGALNVLDGFGQIDIVNNDGRQVVLGRLDVGEDPTGTGRGTAGRIEITDIYRLPTPSVNKVVAVKTIYTRDNGQVTGERLVGYISGTGEFIQDEALSVRGGSTDIIGTNRTATYNPQQGIRYVYTTGVDNSTKTVTHYQGAEYLGNSDWRIPSGAHVVSSTTTTLKSYRLSDGTYIAFDTVIPAGSSVLTETVTTSNGTPTETVVSSWSTCNWWTLCIASDYDVIMEKVTPTKTITTNTMKGDNPIRIGFIGADTGSINVTSNGSVVLNGQVNNKTGATAISSTGGDITQGSPAAIVTARDITLNSAGSVGGTANGTAVRIALTGGSLNANATAGNVVVQASTAIQVGTIKAAGSASAQLGKVVLDANGSITAANGSSIIQAPRVELVSRNGQIGTAGAALLVNTGHAATSDAAAQIENLYSGLAARAAGDINLRSAIWVGNTSASILVDQVVSTGGNVKLSTPGAILDNNPIQSIDARTYSDLLAYWNGLGLLAGTANTDKVNAVIRAFESQVANERQIYLQMRSRQPDGGAAYDPGFTYQMTASEKLAFASGLRLTNADITQTAIDAQTAAYEAEQTARYHRIDAQLQTLSGSFDQASGAYTASQAERDARSTGSVWTEKQLAFSLSAGVLKTITGTNPVIKAPNVSGHTVTLDAGSGIGEVQGNVEIRTDIEPINLSDAQKIALATAERGDFSYSNGVITIRSIRPLNFAAANQLDASVSAAAGNAYLASMGNAVLGAITVPGELRLKVRGSIVNAGTNTPAVSAGSFILEASNGGIGVSRDLNGAVVPGTLRIAAVNTSGTPGNYRGTLVARAALGVNLAMVADVGQPSSGDANIDTLYSRGDIRVVADKAIRNANGDSLINMLGSSISLEAKAGSIGAADNRLNLGNTLGGAVDLKASGDIYVNGTVGYALTLRTLAAGGAIDATSAGNLSLSGLATAGSSATFTAAGSVRMLGSAGLAATGAVSITATAGDVQVTNVATTAGGANAIAITAAGRILAGTAAGRTDLMATGTGAGITLTAQAGIGDRYVANTTLADATSIAMLNRLRVNAAAVTATTTTGTIGVEMLADVGSGRFETSNGSIDLVAAGKLASTALLAGSTVTASANGRLTVGTVTSGGTQRLSSGGDLVFDYLKTLGIATDIGDIHLTSSNGSISGTEADANGSVFVDAKTGLTFIRLRSGKNMTLNAGGSVSGDDLDVGGELRFNFGGGNPIHFKKLAGADLVLQSGGPLMIDRIDVSNTVSFQSPDTVVSALNYTGTGRLGLSLTGYGNGMAQRAALDINATGGIDVGALYLVDGQIRSNSANFAIADGLVGGSLDWQAPSLHLWMDNRNQTPVLTSNVQLYSPGAHFALDQAGNRTITSSYIVRYGDGSAVGLAWDGEVYLGSSMVRDFERMLQAAAVLPRDAGLTADEPKPAVGWTVMTNWMRGVMRSPVSRLGNQPAVNLGGEKDDDPRRCADAQARSETEVWCP